MLKLHQIVNYYKCFWDEKYKEVFRIRNKLRNVTNYTFLIKKTKKLHWYLADCVIETKIYKKIIRIDNFPKYYLYLEVKEKKEANTIDLKIRNSYNVIKRSSLSDQMSYGYNIHYYHYIIGSTKNILIISY